MGDSSRITIDEGLQSRLFAHLRRSDPVRFHTVVVHATIDRSVQEAAAWRYEQLALWMAAEFGVRVWAKSKGNNYWMETDSEEAILILKLSFV